MKESDIKVYETKDYDMFKKLLGNRSVNPRQVNNIIKSISEVGVLPQPILVNEKFEVVDGQNRLEAFKKLECTVLFIVKEGLGVRDCIRMNMNNSKWKMDDYIDCFADLGNENYIKLKKLAEAYPFSKSLIASMTLGHYNSAGGGSKIMVTRGEYTLSDEEYNKAVETLDKVMELWDVAWGKGGNKTSLYDAIRFTVTHDVDLNRMKTVIEKMTFIEKYSDTYGYLRLFSEAYNRGLRSGRIYLHNLMEQEVDQAKLCKNIRDHKRKIGEKVGYNEKFA